VPGRRCSHCLQICPLCNRSILILDGTWLGSPVKAHLHFFREEEGLFVYEICVTISGQLLAEVFIKAIIKLAVLALIVLLAPVAAGGAAVLAWNSPLTDSVRPDGQQHAGRPVPSNAAQRLGQPGRSDDRCY
jgi:hypothetical protein